MAQLCVRQGAPGSMRTLAGRAAAAAATAAAAAPVSEVAEVASKLSTGAGMVRDRGGGGAQGELRHVRLLAGEIRGMTIG